MYDAAVFLCAIAAGAIASVAGFGIGSLLTPLLALHAGTKTAFAAVSIPHLIGTGLRFWRLRASVDRAVLWRFGLMSAAGGLAGARMPVYVVVERAQVQAIFPLVLIATAGVVAGTLAGERLLTRVPERRFRQVVGAIILVLGIGTLLREVA